MQIVDIIALSDTGAAQAMTTRGPSVFQDVPVKPVVILSGEPAISVTKLSINLNKIALIETPGKPSTLTPASSQPL